MSRLSDYRTARGDLRYARGVQAVLSDQMQLAGVDHETAAWLEANSVTDAAVRALQADPLRRAVVAWLRILGCSVLAFAAGALSIDWLGTSWWSVTVAILTALTVMWPVLRKEHSRGES